MTKDEALRLALEALESAVPKYTRQRKDQKTEAMPKIQPYVDKLKEMYT